MSETTQSCNGCNKTSIDHQTNETNEADELDPRSSFASGRWVLLSDHLAHVRDEASKLAASLQCHQFERALSTAGLWHDVGKAHTVFQEKLLGPLRERPQEMPEGNGPWAKSNHRLRHTLERSHFRHELASALAWLAAGDTDDPGFANLVAYLIAAHHGKVRLSLRAGMHIRFKFFDALTANDERAKVPLKHLQQLYAIERECKQQQFDVERRSRYRLERSLPILKDFYDWSHDTDDGTAPEQKGLAPS